MVAEQPAGEDGMGTTARPLKHLRAMVLAIGDDAFAESLFALLHEATGADHCLVFRFRYGFAPSCLTNSGKLLDCAGAMAQRYARGLYSMDASFPRVLSMRAGDTPLVLAPDPAVSTVFKERFLDAFALSDTVGLGIATENARYYALILRADGARFSTLAHQTLAASAGEIGAAIAKHFFYKFCPDRTPDTKLDLLLGGDANFSDITGRERDMCCGILQGSSSNEIAADLGISVNSVLTYRKRLYQRLGISSQHELFERVLRATLYKRARAV